MQVRGYVMEIQQVLSLVALPYFYSRKRGPE